MGKMNKTSKELSKARGKSLSYHANRNGKLYEEYLASGAQFTKTFVEWKKSR